MNALQKVKQESVYLLQGRVWDSHILHNDDLFVPESTIPIFRCELAFKKPFMITPGYLISISKGIDYDALLKEFLSKNSMVLEPSGEIYCVLTNEKSVVIQRRLIGFYQRSREKTSLLFYDDSIREVFESFKFTRVLSIDAIPLAQKHELNVSYEDVPLHVSLTLETSNAKITEPRITHIDHSGGRRVIKTLEDILNGATVGKDSIITSKEFSVQHGDFLAQVHRKLTATVDVPAVLNAV